MVVNGDNVNGLAFHQAAWLRQGTARWFEGESCKWCESYRASAGDTDARSGPSARA